MNRAYESLVDTQSLDTDTSLVKSYLLESPLRGSDGDIERAQALLRELFASPHLSTRKHQISAELDHSEDPSLVTVTVTDAGRAFTTYFDLRDIRFWVMHTLGASSSVDWLVARLTGAGPDLDRAWIPAGMLEDVSHWGFFRGLGLDYDHRPFLDEGEEDGEGVTAPVEMLKVQLWGNKARDVLQILRAQHAFPRQTTLSKVKIKHRLADDSPELFSIDDVKYDGKVTARGTSFQSHADLLRAIQRTYAEAISAIETVSLAWRLDEGAARMSGAPIFLHFSEPLEDLDGFCSTLFSGSEPFRLWGHPVQLAPQMRRIHAVDLHVGHRLMIEVSPSFLRVYQPSDGCGNTVMRLYTNLQHTFDSQVQVTTAQGDSALAL